ncbi:YIP1 family protein [Roseovarius sp. E0-M6]|uniref:YIP1 family protein n=1 Tax=Roseovarius sp. E0-M6 TaxID=3127118 RepID=UPI00300FE250
MSVSREIVATYRGPGRVIRRLLSDGVHEGRALAILMGACLIVFVAQWPRLSREAHLTGQELNPLLGGALLGWVFIAPLFFYLLAFIIHLLSRAFGGSGTGYGARVALFWAFLASTPLVLLHGLVAGFVGPGPGLLAVGVLWCGVFLWFWIAGTREAEWGQETA